MPKAPDPWAKLEAELNELEDNNAEIVRRIKEARWFIQWAAFNKALTAFLDRCDPPELQRLEVERLAQSAWFAFPQNASLWKEYRTARAEIGANDDDEQDAFEAIAAAFS